jgi:hypothetical protein
VFHIENAENGCALFTPCTDGAADVVVVGGTVVVVLVVVVVVVVVVVGLVVVAGALVGAVPVTVVLDDPNWPPCRCHQVVAWNGPAFATAAPNATLVEMTDTVTTPVRRRRAVPVILRLVVGRIVSFQWLDTFPNASLSTERDAGR